jgi:membrane fusion protein (multidrug efflux system)
VLTPDGIVEPRVIAADREVGDAWLISSGLAAGDRVIVEGLQLARPGAHVDATPFTPAKQ